MRYRKSFFCLFVCFLLLLTSCTGNRTEETSGDSRETKADGEIEVIIGGDLMCQRRQQKAALKDGKYDFRYQFDYVRDLVSDADLAIGNLETNIAPSWPLSKDKRRRYGQPYLNGPKEYLAAVKDCGFDVLVNANNHNCDTGVDGLLETLENQDAYALLHTGVFSGEEKNRFLITDVEGIKIGIVSYAVYYNRSVKDLSREEIDTHLNYYSKEKAKEDFQRMRQQGAEFILAYYHCGKEYSFEPTKRQVRIAREMAELGADLLIGGHSHTVSSFERIKTEDGRTVPVAYSLGNFVSHMTYEERHSDYAMILSVTLRKEDGKPVIADKRYYPCLMVKTNEVSGRRYQLVPLTDENIASFDNEATVKKMERAREKIIDVVGPKCRPVTESTEQK